MYHHTTPFANQVMEVAGNTSRSFHALPLSGGASLRGSAFKEIYTKLLSDRLANEISVGAPFLDCLVSPEKELAATERLTAAAYGSDVSLIGTCGTTVSNLIAVNALTSNKGSRVLADRGLHQSVHFALSDRDARVDYLPTIQLDERYGVGCIDIDALKSILAKAEKEHDPYTILLINGQSYDGLIYDVEALLRTIISAGARLRKIFVDEAWGAAHNFHPTLRAGTAMDAANSSVAIENGFCIVSTQSAHKSLSTLRQASLIHVKGCNRVAKYLQEGRYRLHTTSPNLVTLATIDLARAQICTEGYEMLERSLKHADTFIQLISEKSELDCFEVVDLTELVKGVPHISFDPTKVLLRSTNSDVDGSALKTMLFEMFGIYVSRSVHDAVLFNFHIGIQDEDLSNLIDGLKTIAAKTASPSCGSFVIPYPPGVPIRLPGESMNASVLNQIESAKKNGSTLFTVRAS